MSMGLFLPRLYLKVFPDVLVSKCLASHLLDFLRAAFLQGGDRGRVSWEGWKHPAGSKGAASNGNVMTPPNPWG